MNLIFFGSALTLPTIAIRLSPRECAKEWKVRDVCIFYLEKATILILVALDVGDKFCFSNNTFVIRVEMRIVGLR